MIPSELLMSPPEGMLSAYLRSRPNTMSAFLVDLEIELGSHIEGAPPTLRLDHRTLPDVLLSLTQRLRLRPDERGLLALLAAPRLTPRFAEHIRVRQTWRNVGDKLISGIGWT